MSRGPDERKAAVLGCLDRSTRGEQGDAVTRGRAEGIPVEPGGAPALGDRADELDVVSIVTGDELLHGRRACLDEVREGSVECRQAFGALRMLAGRMQASEVGVRDDVDARILGRRSCR